MGRTRTLLCSLSDQNKMHNEKCADKIFSSIQPPDDFYLAGRKGIEPKSYELVVQDVLFTKRVMTLELKTGVEPASWTLQESCFTIKLLQRYLALLKKREN